MIDIKKYSELDQEVKDELNSLIDTEFGHIPIVKETEWATPDWTIINYDSGQILTFYNIILREVEIDGRPYNIGGINNVITPKQFRGKGYSTETLRDTEYLIFEEFKCAFGLLLCADELIPFYNRLNWYQVNCPVYFKQLDERKLWQANTMLLSKNKEIRPKEIDLKGLPW